MRLPTSTFYWNSGGFCKRVELARGGSVTNGTTPSSQSNVLRTFSRSFGHCKFYCQLFNMCRIFKKNAQNIEMVKHHRSESRILNRSIIIKRSSNRTICFPGDNLLLCTRCVNNHLGISLFVKTAPAPPSLT